MTACGTSEHATHTTAAHASSSGKPVLYGAQRTVEEFVKIGDSGSCAGWVDGHGAARCRRDVVQLERLRRGHARLIGQLRYSVAEVKGSDRRVTVAVGTPNPTPATPFVLPHSFLVVRSGDRWQIADVSANPWNALKHG